MVKKKKKKIIQQTLLLSTRLIKMSKRESVGKHITQFYYIQTNYK